MPASDLHERNNEISNSKNKNNTNNNNLWLILQLADSAFPTGGFVHSGL